MVHQECATTVPLVLAQTTTDSDNQQTVYPDGTPPCTCHQCQFEATTKLSHAQILSLSSHNNSAAAKTSTLAAEFQEYLNDSQPCVDILAL